MKKYVLDTNSLIYALNGSVQIPSYDYMVSIITEMELLSYSKLSKKDEDVIIEMLSNFQTVTLTNTIKESTIKIRKQYNLKLPDSIIVATAIEKRAILVTSDKQLLKLDCVKAIELVQLINQ